MKVSIFSCFSYTQKIKVLLTSDAAEFLIHIHIYEKRSEECVSYARPLQSQFLMINDNELCFDGFGLSRELNYLVRWYEGERRESFSLTLLDDHKQNEHNRKWDNIKHLYFPPLTRSISSLCRLLLEYI
jgi:hypothetical protein